MEPKAWQEGLGELLSALAEVAREFAGYVREERERAADEAKRIAAQRTAAVR